MPTSTYELSRSPAMFQPPPTSTSFAHPIAVLAGSAALVGGVAIAIMARLASQVIGLILGIGLAVMGAITLWNDHQLKGDLEAIRAAQTKRDADFSALRKEYQAGSEFDAPYLVAKQIKKALQGPALPDGSQTVDLLKKAYQALKSMVEYTHDIEAFLLPSKQDSASDV